MKDLLKLIYELNGTIITAKNFSEIERKTVEILSKIIPVEETEIWIIKEDKVWVYGKEETISLEETPVAEIIKGGSLIYKRDLSKEKKFQVDKRFYKKGLLSVVYVPLLFEGKVFGIWIVASSKVGAYSEKDLELLKLIASQILAPLKTFVLHEEKKRELELLKTVNYLTKIVLSDVDINTVFREFAKELKKYIPFERLSIGIVEGESIRYAAVSEVIKTGRFAGTRLPLEYTASSWVIKNKKALIRRDLIKEREFPLEEKKIKQGIRSTLHVPLVYKGKVFGTINLSSTKPGTYGEWEKLVVESLVSQISVIIAISYLYSPFYDHLTGVYNRRYFDEKLDEELRFRERYGGEFSLCLCDLDNFKNINDYYGHIEGDNCLKEIAKIIKNTMRKTDFVFRYGGDEFAIIMINTSLEEAVNAGERLKNTVKEKFKDKKITISIGIASYPRDGRTRSEIIDKADRRLLRAKEIKNQIVYKD